MSPAFTTTFRVITRNDDGTPARCSYCARAVTHVAVLPLEQRPELEERIRVGLSGEMWVGLCAHCVLVIAKALAAAAQAVP